MRIVVIGGSGLIGRKLVAMLGEAGHEAIAGSPSTGVDAVTGAGLAEAMTGTDVVVDVSNAPSFEDAAVLAFFEGASRNLLAAEASAAVKHHVALSIVGTDRLPENGYFRAKHAQEQIIAASGIPHTLVRATQFFEFLSGIADAMAAGGRVVVPTGPMQPIAADDVADALARVATGAPVNGIVEIAGPEKAPMNDFVARRLAAAGDARAVVGDPGARYFGARVDDGSLTPGPDARFGSTRFEAWLADA